MLRAMACVATMARSIPVASRSLLHTPTVVSSADGTKVEALIVPKDWQSSALRENIAADAFVPFMRAVIAFAEEEAGLTNYHLRFCANPSAATATKLGLAKLEDATLAAAEQAQCCVLLAGDRLPVREVARAPALEGLGCPIEYTDAKGKRVSLPDLCQQDLLVGEGESARVFLDAQGRAMYVAVLKRFVRRQSELSDAELGELWRLPIELAFAHHESGMVDARLNAGGFQNIAHLHLKVWVREEEFVERWADQRVFKALRRSGSPTWQEQT